MINILLSSQKAMLEHSNASYLKQYIKKDSKIFVLGYSFFDSVVYDLKSWDIFYEKTQYLNELNNIFTTFGVLKTNIFWCNYFTTSIDEIKKNLSLSDILFIPGGAPDQMIKRINEKKILDILNQLLFY